MPDYLGDTSYPQDGTSSLGSVGHTSPAWETAAYAATSGHLCGWACADVAQPLCVGTWS